VAQRYLYQYLLAKNLRDSSRLTEGAWRIQPALEKEMPTIDGILNHPAFASQKLILMSAVR
jgi:hypothetical protein